MQGESQFAIGPAETRYLGAAVVGVAMLATAVQGVAVVSILVLGAAASALPAQRKRCNTAAGAACLSKRASGRHDAG